jgi:hypothetical protein
MPLPQINLFMLGVPEAYHSSKPRAALFPERFNADARSHWERLFKNELITKVMTDLPSHNQKWSYMLHMYMQKCKEKGICPFTGSVGTKNQKILKFLMNARRQIVAFLTEFGLFTEFKIKTVTREFKLKDSGMVVFSSCKLTGVVDKAKFIEHIAAFKFKKAMGGNRYSLMLNSAMFVHLDVANTVRLTYEIRCPVLPEATLRNRVVTDKDYHRFIANRIWLPAIRSVRFPKARRPTLF